MNPYEQELLHTRELVRDWREMAKAAQGQVTYLLDEHKRLRDELATAYQEIARLRIRLEQMKTSD